MVARWVLLLLVGGLCAAPASAEIGGSVGIVSDYIDKGISNSDGHAALQGSLAWTDDNSGLFLGVDGTTVDFNDSTDAELAFLGGYHWEWDTVSVATGVSRTHYVDAPKGAGMDLWEFGVVGSWDMGFHHWEAEIVYSPDDGGAGDALYERLGLTVPLDDRIAVGAHVGHQWYQRKDVGGPAYWHWGAELTYDLAPATLGLAYTDTGLDREAGCLCGPRLSVFMTVSFP